MCYVNLHSTFETHVKCTYLGFSIHTIKYIKPTHTHTLNPHGLWFVCV